MTKGRWISNAIFDYIRTDEFRDRHKKLALSRNLTMNETMDHNNQNTKNLMSSKSNVVHHQTISKEIKQKVHKMISEKQSKQEKDNDYTNAYANKTAAVLVTRKLRSASVPKPPLQPVPDEDDNTAVPLVVDITDKEDMDEVLMPSPTKIPTKKGCPTNNKSNNKNTRASTATATTMTPEGAQIRLAPIQMPMLVSAPSQPDKILDMLQLMSPAKTESMLQLLNANEESLNLPLNNVSDNPPEKCKTMTSVSTDPQHTQKVDFQSANHDQEKAMLQNITKHDQNAINSQMMVNKPCTIFRLPHSQLHQEIINQVLEQLKENVGTATYFDFTRQINKKLMVFLMDHTWQHRIHTVLVHPMVRDITNQATRLQILLCQAPFEVENHFAFRIPCQ